MQPGLFPDDSVPDELIGYRGPSACQIAGITYRQLDYWARTRWWCRPSAGRPAPAASGCTRSRTSWCSRSSSDCSTPVSRCTTSGLRWTICAGAASRIWPNITLFSDGTTVYECTSAEEVVDLLQGGQGVFGIAVSGAMRELTGAIADFPGERADGGESIATPEDELASRRKTRDRKIG